MQIKSSHQKKKQRRPRRVQTQRKSLDKNSTVAPTGVLARPSSVTISRSRVRGDTARGRCFPAIVKVFRPTPANAPPANGFGRLKNRDPHQLDAQRHLSSRVATNRHNGPRESRQQIPRWKTTEAFVSFRGGRQGGGA